jgi:hypothetical protein
MNSILFYMPVVLLLSPVPRVELVELLLGNWPSKSPTLFIGSNLKLILIGCNCRLGLKIAVADADESGLRLIGQELVAVLGAQNVLIIPTDVSKLDQVVRLKDKVYDTWGEVGRDSPSSSIENLIVFFC